MSNLFNRRAALATAASAGALFAVPAFAAAPDYSTLTAAVDFATVITGILGVAAVIMGVLVVVKGVSWIKGQIAR